MVSFSPSILTNHSLHIGKKKILVLAANTRDRQYLKLKPEINKIKSIAGNRNVEVCLNTTTEELYTYLSQNRLPQVIHFCGHGLPDGLLLVDCYGKAHKVSAKALSNLFEHASRKGVQCVFLNTCYSEAIAEAISQHVDFVVGMDSEISDSVAIHFSSAFYKALISGAHYPQSYHAACNRIALESLESSTIPKIKQGNSRHIAQDITAIQKMWLRANTAMDLKPLLQQLSMLREQHPTYSEAQKLETQIRRTAQITRTPAGILPFFKSLDSFSIGVVGIWMGLGIMLGYWQEGNASLIDESTNLILCVCLGGSYITQILYRLAWYSLRPVGTWKQKLLRSLLPDTTGLLTRIVISSGVWLIFENYVLLVFRNQINANPALHSGVIVGTFVGMAMVVFMLWEISMAPVRDKR